MSIPALPSRFCMRLALSSAALATALLLSACSSEPAPGAAAPAASAPPAAAAADAPDAHRAPRVFQNDDGTTTVLPEAPQRILSTSVAITGTLLAIDAPLVASASATNGEFFGQWADVAAARGVANVWPAGGVDLEAAYAVQPDLIVVASAGGDSALAQVDELRRIAPTIVLDYGNHTWQELALRLGDAIGIRPQAQARIDAFDQHVAQARTHIRVPEGTANIISFNGPGINNPIAIPGSAHAQLLEALGFAIEAPDPAWHSGNAGNRTDFVWAQYENLTRLTAPPTFLIRLGRENLQAFTGDPVLANLPSVKSGQVYSLGEHSFRIDYYSGTEIVDIIVRIFGQQ